MGEHISIWPILVLAIIHLFGGRLSFLGGTPRSAWLSMAGGISVAYIFLHLFPELSEGQEQVEQFLGGAAGFLEHHVYLMALLGLVIFYGLERAAITSRKPEHEQGAADQPETGVFWLHISSFAIYNALIGYLLFQREEGPLKTLLLFSLAMALHFVVNDYGLQEHYRKNYKRKGRFVLVAALVLGWALGYAIELPDAGIAMVMAFIGGGVILNILKEELPEERKSRYWAFLLGTSFYAILLLTL